MSKVYNRKHKNFRACTGDRIVVTFEPYYDDDGNLCLKESGTYDLYMDIQSHKESVDLAVILARYQNGDPYALERVQGFYADVSKAPKSYAEMLNIAMRGEREFNALPVDVKDKFDNNFAKFVSMMGSKEWFENLGVKEQKAEEVKENSDNES